jgi:hypothetical protein
MSTLQHDMHKGVISSLLSEHFRMKSLIALIVSSGLLKGNAATFSPHQPAELHHTNWSFKLGTPLFVTRSSWVDWSALFYFGDPHGVLIVLNHFLPVVSLFHVNLLTSSGSINSFLV